MSKNSLKIRRAIAALSESKPEILSGTVVPSSFNSGAQTVNVITCTGKKIEAVYISSITGSDQGLTVIPKDNSNVVIGSIDGPGEWTILKTNELEKVMLNIGTTTLTMDGTDAEIQQGNTVLQMTSTAFKMNTSSESMFNLLKDLVTLITTITVAGTPIDATISTNLTLLSNRINNLLTA
jgi:hypothetical protein